MAGTPPPCQPASPVVSLSETYANTWAPGHFNSSASPGWYSGVIPHWLTNPHPLQLLTPQTGAPAVPLQSLASQTSTHTEENPALRKREMEFNEKRGQTVLIKYRAWPDKPTDQSPVYIWLPPFSPLPLCFPKIFPPQTTCFSPFPCLWFLP